MSGFQFDLAEKDTAEQRQLRAPSNEPSSYVHGFPASRSGILSPASLLRLQQTVGNRAVQRLIASRTSLQRDDDDPNPSDATATPGQAPVPAPDGSASPNQATAAATDGGPSFDQDSLEAAMGRGAASTLQRDLTSDAPPQVSTAPPTFVRVNNVTGPTYSPDGAFTLHTNWSTDGKSGFIIQQIDNTIAVNACSNSNSQNGNQTYWEAWSILADSTVSPSDHGVNDTFDRPTMTSIFHTSTSGNWQKVGSVYWADQLDSSAGFTPGGVRNAGVLLSTTTRPNNLNMLVESRTHAGHWNSCDPAHQTHTPG